MKKNIKFLISSALVALIFSVPQAIHAMEEFEDRINNIKNLSAQGTSIQENPLDPKKYPAEIRIHILERAAIDHYLSYGNTRSLGLVCKDWLKILNEKDFVKKAIRSAYDLSEDDYEIYQRFLNGVLIYKPNEGNDVGKIILPISKLANPLEGTFDLSQCGDAGQHLSISTGYKKGGKPENVDKAEIWFAPRFLIEKELTTTAKHFQEIFDKWDKSAEVGIFWTWGGWDNIDWYDYLITENMDYLSENNLYNCSANGNYAGMGRFSEATLRPCASDFCALNFNEKFLFVL